MLWFQHCAVMELTKEGLYVDFILEQKQIQKLSPQMIQSMEILQMSTLELHEYLEA